jgi:glutaryl-CoA dehydrogenase
MLDLYQTEGLLPESSRILRHSVREFLEKEVRPRILEAFHTETPPDIRALAPKMGALGMLGAFIPEEDGGPGGSYCDYGVVCQEAERLDSSLRSFIAVISALVMYPIWRFGSEAQRRRWLPALAKGEAIGCFGLTEPNAGSDPASMETRARKVQAGWVLNGRKQWISEASIADFAIVWAKTEEGIRGFLIERGTEGFETSTIKKKGSMRASDVGELILEDAFVPDEALLPKSSGLKTPLSCLTQARFGIAWGALGAAEDCFEAALNYAKDRKQFGAPIASYQLVQKKLVDMFIGITQDRLLVTRLARLMQEGKASFQAVSLAKKSSVALARECSAISRELLGANGIALEYPPIRHMMNIESVYTYEGTDDMHTLILGEALTGIGAFAKEA